MKPFASELGAWRFVEDNAKFAWGCSVLYMAPKIMKRGLKLVISRVTYTRPGLAYEWIGYTHPKQIDVWTAGVTK